MKDMLKKASFWFVALAWLVIVPGQLILRFQSASNGTSGIVLADIFAVVCIPFAIYLVWKQELWKKRIIQLAIGWIVVVFLSWLLGSIHHSRNDIIQALGYVIRLAAYISVFVIATTMGDAQERVSRRYAVFTVGGLLFLGALILWYLPNFAPLTTAGWDPHIDRLTSTWLDPNYFGSFLALVFAGALCFEHELFTRSKRQYLWFILFLFSCSFGIYLTVSRSALVTLAVAGLVAGLRTSKRATSIVIIVLLLIFLLPSRLQSRLENSISFVGASGTTLSGTASGITTDPTASERIQSWKKAVDLAKHEPILGVGYNYFEQASITYGLISATGETRGTAGSDSSLLTLLATTGILGFIAVCWFYGYLGWQFLKTKGIWPSVALAAIGGIAVGSQFNNLLLYPLVLLPFMTVLGLAYHHIDHDR